MESIIIGIAGGSGSGKSTFTNRIKKHFGDDVVVIYHDNYYRRQDGILFEKRVKVNYDHPDSLETDLLVEHLKQLKAGKSIECPVYDYSQHNRSDKVIKIEPRPVILVEGILLLADERIRDLLDIKVYVEADADERILRRISRDVEERGRDLNGIIEQYLTTVKPMHYLYVEPTRAKADIVINSGKNNVAFDLFVSKIRQLLEQLSDQDKTRIIFIMIVTIIEKVYSFLWGDMIRIPLPGGSGLGILFYARSNVAYLFGDKWCWQTAYKILALIMLFSGGIAAYTFVWDLGDVGIGLMTIFNIIFLYPLSGQALNELKEYEAEKKNKKDRN